MRLPSIVDAVEFRRDAYQLTQRDWAKVIGISESHYSEFVSGKRNLTLKQAANCFSFGVPAECLFQCTNSKHIEHIAKILGDVT
jgi:antitoxin component HigA of HigAB toxin-antitoxin module